MAVSDFENNLSLLVSTNKRAVSRYCNGFKVFDVVLCYANRSTIFRLSKQCLIRFIGQNGSTSIVNFGVLIYVTVVVEIAVFIVRGVTIVGLDIYIFL